MIGANMGGETNLKALLRQMRPVLHAAPYGYGMIVAGQSVPKGPVFSRIVEDEGTTLIAPLAELAALGLQGLQPWARISLLVHSDLAAVGLTAAIAAALTAENISANVVAGYFHDHIFVQWDRSTDAMAALKALSDV